MESGGILIVPYPEFVPLNVVVYADNVEYSDDDHNYVEEEHEADESLVFGLRCSPPGRGKGSLLMLST
jgi:hypothetical protein